MVCERGHNQQIHNFNMFQRVCWGYFFSTMCVGVSLEVKFPTIWTDEKQRWEESEKRREEERGSKQESQKKEDPGARKGRKVAKHSV